MSRNIVIIGASGTIGSSLVNIYKKNSDNQVYAFSRGYNYQRDANLIMDDIDILDEGMNNNEFEPEERIPNQWDLGNLNVEYAIIWDAEGKELYRDEDLKEELIPEENKNEIVEFDKEILKSLKIIPINEAKSILEHTLIKPISPLDLTESDILEAQKNRYSDTNLKENIRH